MSSRPSIHFLFFAAHMWGHTRPMSVAISRMVKLRPIIVSFPIAANVYDRAKAEILSKFQPGEEEARSRVRGQPVACETVDGKQGTVNLQSAPLSTVVLDGFVIPIFDAVYEQRETIPALKNVKIYSFLTTATSYILAMHTEDRMPLADAVAEQEGIPFNEAAYKIWIVPQGRVIRTPSLPPSYDHELDPQAAFLTSSVSYFTRTYARTDGFLTIDAVEFDPESAEAKVYHAGPLLSSRQNAPGFQVDGTGKEVMKFLDNQLSSSGELSVIYISFGTLFWPADPKKIVAVLQVLIEQNIPFIITCPNPLATIPDDFLEELKQHPNALLTKWVPQLAVLEHPATGWCLTHGGHNSAMECIHAAVPMIFWPISADQPTVAVHLTDHLDVGYELLEVRNGIGLGKIFRTGKTLTGTLDAVRAELRDVLLCAFGEDGAARRARLLKLRKRLEEAWTENGTARTDVEAFLDVACAGAPAGIITAD
ncbi:UDP-Glycosyltransferase/glycogen phosphorylase [Trametes punicea]|nr:UDP-Glycosyltransferase/glycogen phosphorylase [Trametes punicea]